MFVSTLVPGILYVVSDHNLPHVIYLENFKLALNGLIILVLFQLALGSLNFLRPLLNLPLQSGRLSLQRCDLFLYKIVEESI